MRDCNFERRRAIAIIAGFSLSPFLIATLCSTTRSDVPGELRRWFTPQVWQRDTDGPIVSLGEPSQFDDTHIFAPAVVREDDRFLMWYCGSAGTVSQRVFRLGLAVSRDGKSFEKHASSPVFDFGDQKRSILTINVTSQSVMQTSDGGFRIWYSSRKRPQFVNKYFAINTARWPGLGPTVAN